MKGGGEEVAMEGVGSTYQRKVLGLSLIAALSSPLGYLSEGPLDPAHAPYIAPQH